MSPEGPLPIQARLQATTLEKAYEEFPGAMREALAQMIKELQALYREQERSKRDSSRIIMPGQL
jgi:histidinol dehydrogenase